MLSVYSSSLYEHRKWGIFSVISGYFYYASHIICQAVQKELDSYNENINPLIGFFADLDRDIDIINQPLTDVYRRYKLYCTDNGFTPISNIEFSKQARKAFDVDIKRIMIKRQRYRIFIERGGAT